MELKEAFTFYVMHFCKVRIFSDVIRENKEVKKKKCGKCYDCESRVSSGDTRQAYLTEQKGSHGKFSGGADIKTHT